MGLVALYARLVELDGLQVGMVAEGRLGHRHGAGVVVVALSLARSGIDDGVGCVRGYFFNIGMIAEILLRGGDDVTATDQSNLVYVRQNVGLHALQQQVAVVGACAAPILRREVTGSGD